MKLHIIPDRKNIEKSLALAERYNASFEYNDFFLPDVLDNTVLTDEIIDIYKQHKLPENCSFHGAFLDITIFSNDRRIREVSDFRVNQSLDIARKIGSHNVVFHTNYLPTFLSESYRSDWLIKNISYWHNKLEEYSDMNIYIENMFDTDPELLARLGNAMADEKRFGVCFDYAHAAVSPTDFDRWATALAPYVKHIHINDNDLVSDLHQAVGTGKIDWDRFISIYPQFMHKPHILIEVSSIEAQEKSLEYLFAKESFRSLCGQ